MSIGEELHAICHQAKRELATAHDFFSHTRVIWAHFATLVGQGLQFTDTSPATGTTVDQDDLVRLAPDYLRRYLTVLTFKQFVATFETFFFDFLNRVLRHNPWQFARSQLELEVVLKAQDRDEVVSTVLGKQVNELKYERPRAWFEALNKAIRLDCPQPDEIDALAEIKATRDLLEHNAGVVNDTYLRKAGKNARSALGEVIEIDGPYHHASWVLLKKLVEDLSVGVITRLASE